MQTVHLAVYDELADWETGYVTAAIGHPRFHAHPGEFEVQTVGETLEPVRTMGGLRVVPDLALDALSPSDSAMLLLPGANGWDSGSGLDPARWTSAAEAFLDAGVPVAAICGATFGLADAGLLDHRAHTSSAAQYLSAAPGYAGADRYIEADAVNGGGIITAGTTDPLAFAREVIAELGVYSAEVLASWFALHDTHRPEHFFALQQAAGAVAD